MTTPPPSTSVAQTPDGFCVCDDGPRGSARDCGVRRHREQALARRRSPLAAQEREQ